MKQIIQRIFTCLILGVVFCTTAWAAEDKTFDASTMWSYDLTVGQTYNITYTNRTFQAGAIETICLPFAISKEQIIATFGEGTTVWEYTAQNEKNAVFSKVNIDNGLAAATPYLIKTSKTVTELHFQNVEFGLNEKSYSNSNTQTLKHFEGSNYYFYGCTFKHESYQACLTMSGTTAYSINNRGQIGNDIYNAYEDHRTPSLSANFFYVPGNGAPTISIEGYDPNSGGGTTTDPDDDETPGTGGQGGSVDPSSMAYKIAHKQQITNLPTVYITIPDVTDLKTQLTKNRQTGEALYHNATMTIKDDGNDGTNIQLENLIDEPFEIKVRGNSTAEPEKRPYRVKFPKGHKHDLIGNGYTKRNWTLLANCFDHSMIRNAVTYELGKEIGMPFNAGYKFVDLVINGDYRGTYQISDHVEVGSNRIDIDETTGWYVEFQGRGDMLDEPYVNPGGVPMFSIKNPDYADPGEETQLATLKSEMTAWIQDYVTGWSYDPAVFASPTTGWRAYNDEAQLVKFVLETEITADWDGYMTVKAYRDPNGGKLFWGPVWDKDLAYGNYEDMEEKLACSVNASTLKYYVYNDGTNNLFHDAKFIKKLKTAYDNLIAGGIEAKLNTKIDQLTTLLSQSEKLNFEKWTYTDNHNGLQKYHRFTNHADYTAQVKTFLHNRLAWFGTYLQGVYDELGCAELPDEPEDVDPGDDTPVGELGALVDLGNGKYSYTGSASTFKKDTEITITTSENTTLSNYITEGNTWNTTNTITLTADDVTALAANDYTFYMNATGGEVKAVNVKVPVVAGGLSDGSPTGWGSGTVYTYKFNKSDVKVDAQVKFTLAGTGNFYADIFTTNSSTQDYGIYGSQTSFTRTLTAEDVEKIIANNYSIKIIAYNCTSVSVEVVGASSGGSDTPTTPTYALTLSASEGGTVTGAGTYAEGTTVLIKAIPNEGYRFSKWSDDNTHAVRSVTLNEAITLTATFVSDDTPAIRQQLTNLPTIYLDAATVDDAWKGVALEVFDKDNVFGQGVTWTKTTADVSAQYQGSGDKNKDSYRLKFESKIKLMGTNKYKQWVLLANDDDPSMINNALAKELGDAVGMPWTPGYQFVDLYVNNTYMGTYQVTDRVKAEDGRSLVSSGNNKTDWQVRFNDDTELTEDGTQDYITATNGVNVIYKNPDPKDYTSTPELVATFNGIKSDMQTYFNNVFTKNTEGEKPTYPNFAANVDKDQLINWYICQEILGVYKGFSSIEAYRSVTATAADNLLHFGPLWDSEKAFGNRGEADAIDMSDKATEGSFDGLMTNYAAYGEMKALFNYLWTQPWFGSGVRDKWNALKTVGLLASLKDKADAISGTLLESQPKNAEKWTESLGGSTYATAISNIKTYLDTRFDYLGTKFTERAAGLCDHEYASYVDNGDGTHSQKCSKCNLVSTTKTVHSYTAKDNHPYCATCGATETATISGTATDDTKVYRLHEATTKTDIAYVTTDSEFAPGSNKIYICDEEITDETVNLKNVVWPRSADGDYNGNEIVLSDGDYTYDEKASMHVKSASYTRSMSSTWGTLCLPFKVASCEDYTLYEIKNTKIGDDNKSGTIVFSEIAEASGLQPVVFRKNTSAGSVTFRGVAQTKAGADNGLVTVKKSKKLGNTDAMLSTGVEGAGTWALYGNVKKSKTTADIPADFSNVYYIASNKFWQGDADVTVGTFRAVFVFTPDPGNTSSAKSFAIEIGDDATAINGNTIEKNLAIFAGNGEVILNSNYDTRVSIYNINGTTILNTNLEKGVEKSFALPKGIYIINGTKVAVK